MLKRRSCEYSRSPNKYAYVAYVKNTIRSYDDVRVSQRKVSMFGIIAKLDT